MPGGGSRIYLAGRSDRTSSGRYRLITSKTDGILPTQLTAKLWRPGAAHHSRRRRTLCPGYLAICRSSDQGAMSTSPEQGVSADGTPVAPARPRSAATSCASRLWHRRDGQRVDAGDFRRCDRRFMALTSREKNRTETFAGEPSKSCCRRGTGSHRARIGI